MWDLPGSGTEPVSPALQGRFLTPGPPGKLMSKFLIAQNDSQNIKLVLSHTASFLLASPPLEECYINLVDVVNKHF